jgi:hypothetical protein
MDEVRSTLGMTQPWEDDATVSQLTLCLAEYFAYGRRCTKARIAALKFGNNTFITLLITNHMLPQG